MTIPSSITEAERQVLIVLIELAEPVETPNNTHYRFYPKTKEEAASYFLSERVDWNPAYPTLAARGWITTGEPFGWSLTETGKAVASQERSDHPPIWYWYRKYYRVTENSQVYSRFCEALYGRDLCQTNFSDMAQLDFLIKTAGLRPGMSALDLGCGKGLFAEYLSDCSGARVWGIDYTPEAIEQALERTQPKRDRLDFRVCNFDHLDFPDESFDLLISIDTLYMPADLPAALRKLRSMLTPSGRLLVFYSSFCFDPAQSRDTLTANGTDLARALQAVGMPYQTWDFSEPTFHLMRRKHKLAQSMRADFEQEGTLFLWEHLIAESDSSDTDFDPSTLNITRYLYQAVR